MSRIVSRARSLVEDRSPWHKLLVECQIEISATYPHPHYLEAYRAEEVKYWQPVAQWLYMDRKSSVHKVLDIGCAYGTLALYSQKLFHCPVYCTDFTDIFLSPTLVEKHALNFAVNNIELDEFPWDTKFDIIIFTEILEHLNFHPVPTLQKIRSLLASDGRLYLSTPDAAEWGHLDHSYATVDAIPYPRPGMPVVDAHVYQYRKDELVAVVTAAGFRIERMGFAPGGVGRHFNLTLATA